MDSPRKGQGFIGSWGWGSQLSATVLDEPLDLTGGQGAEAAE